MIGQKNLTDIFESIEDESFPHFIILVGDKGSGKKTFIKEVICKDLMHVYYLKDNSVTSVRELIASAYKLYGYTFVFPDADTMSLAAQNALLKVVEECPNNNYFIMTLTDENNTLETIRSRAFVYHMDSYTPEEIEEYASRTIPDDLVSVATEVCDNPGEVDVLFDMGIQKFYSYVQKVIDNIAVVSGANSFKISEPIALKDEEDKYDLKLFWKAFISCCLKRCGDCDKEDILRYARGSQITSKALRDLRIKGINKQALFDHWVLDIRQEWK